MIIEFIGCTGSGKSTINKILKEKLNNQNCIFLNVGGKIIYDFFAFPFFIIFFLRNTSFCLFMLNILIRDGDSIINIINIYRNFIKRMGMYTFISFFLKRKKIVWDEGTIHTIHNFFVHSRTKSNESEIIKFSREIPKPDIIFYVKSPIEHVIQRTINRSHKRIKKDEDYYKFIENAMNTFNILNQQTEIKKLIVEVENNGPDVDSINSQIDFITTKINKF